MLVSAVVGIIFWRSPRVPLPRRDTSANPSGLVNFDVQSMRRRPSNTASTATPRESLPTTLLVLEVVQELLPRRFVEAPDRDESVSSLQVRRTLRGMIKKQVNHTQNEFFENRQGQQRILTPMAGTVLHLRLLAPRCVQGTPQSVNVWGAYPSDEDLQILPHTLPKPSHAEYVITLYYQWYI